LISNLWKRNKNLL